ncbi:MAG TPA: hypothetical protein VHO69_01000 [Phototrophicaceae bacterium]|nr:hypothetical protein [Phototrophicaceae bacterium]
MNKVALIGWPVAHSISPAMHNAAFAALGLTDWTCELALIRGRQTLHSSTAMTISRIGYGINSWFYQQLK